MIIVGVEAEAEALGVTTIIIEAGARVKRGNGRNTNIKRVDTDVVTKMMKTMIIATLPCRRIIHPHLRGVTAGITQRNANTVKIRRGSTTKEKRTSTTNTKERKEIVIAVVAQVVDHRQRQELPQYLQRPLELMNLRMH